MRRLPPDANAEASSPSFWRCLGPVVVATIVHNMGQAGGLANQITNLYPIPNSVPVDTDQKEPKQALSNAVGSQMLGKRQRTQIWYNHGHS